MVITMREKTNLSFALQDRPIIKVGDLVRVRPGVNDPKLPVHRTGLVVRDMSHLAASGEVFNIQFGSVVLRFHVAWLEKIDEV